MDIQDISTSAKRALELAGWSENRAVDIQQQIVQLDALGYPISEIAQEFLSTFGYLSVGDNDSKTEFEVPDGPSYATLVELGVIDAANNPLCLVGQSRVGPGIYILIDPTGSLYQYIIGSSLALIHESLVRGLERIVHGVSFQKILFPQNDDQVIEILNTCHTIGIIGDLNSRKTKSIEDFLQNNGYEVVVIQRPLESEDERELLAAINVAEPDLDIIYLIDWLDNYPQLLHHHSNDVPTVLWVEYISDVGLAMRKQLGTKRILFGPITRYHERFFPK
jgi:hypothetical protein